MQQYEKLPVEGISSHKGVPQGCVVPSLLFSIKRIVRETFNNKISSISRFT